MGELFVRGSVRRMAVGERISRDKTPSPVLRGPVGKSDEVRTTFSVKVQTVWPIEELDIRSMSL